MDVKFYVTPKWRKIKDKLYNSITNLREFSFSYMFIELLNMN